jgi:filamentous hemagglutinin family protein
MKFQVTMTIALLLTAIATPAIAQSLIVPDTTLGAESSIVQPRNDGTLKYDVITGGATRGTGLFHSFSQFNVGDRLNAQFSVSPAIQNIFARVTGGDISRIDGLLGTGIDNGTTLVGTTASLFLLNPNGIIFGPNAKLDLGGSFLATTATGFKFAGGQEFSAVNPQTAPLLTVSVPTGLQFGRKVGGIEVNGVKLSTTSDAQSLGLIGGDVKITDSTLSTITGQLDVGAVGAGETVGFVPLPIGWKVNYDGVQKFQDIQVDRSQIRSGASKVGDFAIFPIDLKLQGRQIRITNQSNFTYGYEDVNFKNLIPGKVRLTASESIDFNNSSIFNFSDGTISTPGIEINTGVLKLSNKSAIFMEQNGGVAGNIDINASQRILLQDGAKGRSQIFSANYSQGDTSGAAVNIVAPSLEIYGGSSLATLLVTKGRAGDINLKVDRLIVAGEQQDLKYPSAISSGSAGTTNSIGDTGNINIDAGSVDLTDGGSITISRFGQGKPGVIDLQVRGAIVANGSTSQGLGSSIGHLQEGQVSKADASLPGVKIRAERLVLKNGGRVDTKVIDDGDSLGIDIQVDKDVMIQGSTPRSQVTSQGDLIFSPSAISTSRLGGIGNGGNIRIKAKTVELLEGGEIESNIAYLSSDQALSGGFQGKAGDILIVADDRVMVAGQKRQSISSTINLFPASSISSTVGAYGNAQGGKIQIQTGTLQVLAGGEVESDMLGRGQAGAVEINAAGDVTVSGSGRDSFSGYGSAISSFASFSGQGDAGSVTIRSNNLNILDGGLVSTATSGSGRAGEINIAVENDVTIRGQSVQGNISRLSSASASFTPEKLKEQLQISQALDTGSFITPLEQLGNGGAIRISARNLRISDRSFISAISEGRGAAGNISIQLSDRAILNNAEIKTSSNRTSGGNIDLTARGILLRDDANIKTAIQFGRGSGGNIQLNAGAIVLLEDSDILAFAPEGQGGNITLNTQALLTRTYKPSDPTSGLLTLDTNGFVDINATGATSGVITLPRLNPLQNNRAELPQGLLDADKALSRSCLARNPNTGKFYITGAGGIPPQPGDPTLSNYSTLPVASTATEPVQIVEADGFYPLDNGKFVFGKACQAAILDRS